jgi:hypothetical protein
LTSVGTLTSLTISGNLTVDTNSLFVNSVSGNVGLGTTSVTYRLTVNGNAAKNDGSTAWVNNSDVRLKENIQNANLEQCYYTVKSLPLRRFTWKEKYNPQIEDKNMLGWVAQEVKPFFPKSISEHEEFGISDCMGLDTTQIYHTMYGALQKLINKTEK